MNRWVRYALLLWLAIAGVIVVTGVIRIHDGSHVGSVYRSDPGATIDGVPAYVMHATDASGVERPRGRAWVRHWCMLVPAHEMKGATNDRAQYWPVVAVERPFRLTLEKPDGSRTDPLPVTFLSEVITWAPDGRSFAFPYGVSPGQGVFAAPGERIWNAAVVRQYVLEHVLAIVLVGVGVALVTLILRARRIAWERKYARRCHRCGYDLRGGREPGCPECGWRR